MECPKCHRLMIDDSSSGITALMCLFCGNRHYPGYPKRPGNIEICHRCGKEFEKNRAHDRLCNDCRELILLAKKHLKKRTEAKVERESFSRRSAIVD